METIDIILDKLTQFFSGISSKLGLADWQLLTITLAVIVVLVLIARYQRKARIKSIHATNSNKRPDTIGTKLIAHETTSAGIENAKKQKERTKKQTVTFFSKKIGKHKSWRKTIKDLRKVTEQTRRLKYENNKHKKTEGTLGQKTAGQTTDYINQKHETSEHEYSGRNPKHRIKEIIIHNQTVDGTTDSNSVSDSPKTEPAIQATTDINIQQQDNKSEETAEEKLQENYTEDNRSKTETKHLEGLMDTENQNQKVTIENKQENEGIEPKNVDLVLEKQSQGESSSDCEQDAEPTEENIENGKTIKHYELPLDVKELRAIAELAKRLSGKKRQHQNG